MGIDTPNTPLPALPHWEQTPAELPAAISQLKAAMRARIAASGRTVDEVFAVVERQVRAEVGEIAAARERGETIWPVIDYADIEAGTVAAGAQARLRRWLWACGGGCWRGGAGLPAHSHVTLRVGLDLADPVELLGRGLA